MAKKSTKSLLRDMEEELDTSERALRKSEPFPVGITRQPCSEYCERFVISQRFQSG